MTLRPAAIGISNFEKIMDRNVFYVDKTYLIKDWWENRDEITLITRPRRFGKTLTLSMLETFFSNQYADRGDLFEGLAIWEDEQYRAMQGQYPVINVSLADVKQSSYESMTAKMKRLMASLYKRHRYLLESEKLLESDKKKFMSVIEETITDEECMESLLKLAEFMNCHFEKPVIILVDEYDTPMLEAYTAGFWEEAIVFIRRMFHATFKDNPYLERGLMTGITRITQESIFSDLNNLKVVTTTTKRYEDCFGFTEEEVFAALDEYGLSDQKAEVKRWYDGFRFGEQSDIYNPWSIINFLADKEYKPYWMNTSGNALVGKLVQEGSLQVKDSFETMLKGGSVMTEIDEAITYAELKSDTKTIWSWFLTTGYVKIIGQRGSAYEIALTNYEVQEAFYRLVKKWFANTYDEYTEFVRMLLADNLEGIQRYMRRVTEVTFSYFDVGGISTESEKAEQFYHGFTLGLIADLNRTHIVTSNRESGFGRYDVCIEPIDKNEDGIIIEFKVFDAKKEASLEETAARALSQIEEKNYEADLKARGITNVRKYGFAFQGKEVLIAE